MIVHWENKKRIIRRFCRELSKAAMFLFAVSLSTIVLSSNSVFAAPVKSTLTLGLDTNALAINLQPSTTGTFGDSGNATIRVRTNNFTGYTLSIEAKTSTSLNGPNNTAIDSISSIVSGSDFSNPANTQYNNKWGFKPSQYVDNSNPNNPQVVNNDNFLPSPTTTGTIIDITNIPNATVDNTYTMSLGARIDDTLYAGAYSNDFIVRAVSHPIVYNITYDKNTGDTVTNMPNPNPQGAEIPGGTETSESYATLSSFIPTRTGYTFRGWCDVHTIDDSTTGNQTCGGNTYQAGANYGIDQTLNNANIAIYAIWEANQYTITLNSNGGSGGSATTNVIYGATTLGAVTNPVKSSDMETRTISGFTAGTGATDATITFSPTQPSGSTCADASDCSSTKTITYTFNGWHESYGSGTLVASNASVPVLQANVLSYTNSSSQWINSANNVTLYAGWNSAESSYSAITLPSIEKIGNTCGWSTDDMATDPTYASGASLTPAGNMTLYGICKENVYTITFKANGGTGSDYTQTVTGTNSVNLADNSFTRSNYYFKGWGTNDSSVTYRTGQSVAPVSDLTLYAIWGNSTNMTLYNIVGSLTKGTQTATDLKKKPSKTNSGVFTYDATEFGTSSDAANTSAIYYYRGVLDNVIGAYGSDGDAANYPNYVKLNNNTCWRIVRTTGNGGVKMIYNGIFGATTSDSCVNAEDNAQLSGTTYVNRGTTGSSDNYGTKGFAVYVGYNFNSTFAYDNKSYNYNVNNSLVYGNGTTSNIRTQIENWYSSNLTSYTSKFQTSAGYCTDRTTYLTTDGTATSSSVPYAIESADLYFGAYIRNYTTDKTLSLRCPNTTGYDLLSVSNGMSYPVALLTADEMSLAGSGYGASYASHYADNSYLRSGMPLWTMSPYNRGTDGRPNEFILNSNGRLGYGSVNYARNVRPVVSLVSGVMPVSGSGTATSPWVINP